MAYHLKRLYREYLLLSILINIYINLLQSDGIVKALLIDNILKSILSTSLSTCYWEVPLCRYYVNGIPTLCNSLFPLCDFLSQLVVVLRNLLETFSLFLVELRIIVIELTLHGVVRSNLCDRVLDNFTPALRDTFLVLIIVERNNLILEQTINGSSIELILIPLVLVCALLSKSPSGTLTIALKPPAVFHAEVYNTVHLSLLTRCT